MAPIKFGTRRSRLALWQTEWAVQRLRAAHPDLAIEIVPMRTVGDRAVDLPLGQIGDKGLFVKDLELALLDGSIDVAVHSLKDLPSILTTGLTLAAYGPREDPRDALISADGQTLADLPPRSTVGTSSARRAALVRAARPDLEIVPLRGNVETRLEKIARGDCAAGILAVSGLLRLGREHEITEYLDPDICLPAPGQGIITLEIAAARDDLQALIAEIDEPESRATSRAERACTARLTGGCQIPVAAFAEVVGASLRLRAFVADPDGRRVLRADQRGPAADPEILGQAVAASLLERGAADLLARSAEAS